jgi:hypothetical protein
MRHVQKGRPRLAVTSTTEEELANTLRFLEEAWEEGAKEAVALAVSLCSTHEQPPPGWVTLAVACLVSPRYQHDMVHIRRWHLVRILRAEGFSWNDVYGEASKRLADEGAACAPSAVRESYESVQKQLGA